MLLYFFVPTLITGLLSCNSNERSTFEVTDSLKTIQHVSDIPLPDGFSYIRGADTSFADWLLNLKIKKDKTVYLYNGSKKTYQHAQYAILDIPIGDRDLLQCADVTMKLRGDHLYEMQDHEKIKYRSTSGEIFSFAEWKKGVRWKQSGNKLVKYLAQPDQSVKGYSRFMELVYNYCGTYSLSKQLKQFEDASKIQPGDVFVEGGFPGHAVIVLAVAKNKDQKVIFLLAQGYMPAQDIHILINPHNPSLNPWYSADKIDPLITPEWTFGREHLKRW